MTLENYVRQNADRYPNKMAVTDGTTTLTWRQLWQTVEQKAQLLSQHHKPQSVVVMRTTQTTDFLVTYFAIHTIGAVAMPLGNDIPQSQLETIERQYAQFTAPPQVADILYTTGTTGKSKGVMISHDTIIADAENLIDAMGFHHDLAFVINGPLNHIGSLSKIYPQVLTASPIIILEGMKNLEQFFNALDYPCDKIATFLVPASIRMLLQLAKKRLGQYANKIELIEAGAAPLPHSDMLELCQLLPSTRLFNTYASTETGIIATYNYNDGECLAGCLGKPMKNSRFFITPDGRVACQGRTLMTGYAGDEELTAQVLRDNTVFTADNGEIDEQGRLRLLGRNDDVINVGGFKVAPTEVEDAAMAHPTVEDCICVADNSPLLGTRLKLMVVTGDGVELDKKSLARFLASRLEIHKVPMLYEKVSKIERTFNGKLNRKFYRNQ
ncbi:MAG: acyl--CoA ligase [Muribaculaceae bacterium]|nr:acyl--CoA ligase [Muribaculaceae bacterium]